MEQNQKKEHTWSMEDYGKKPPFASFLPGIAGERGKPLWCYYVNRGQGVVSFGVHDKDHAIMEFYPAHTAYQVAPRQGFRTFLQIDGAYAEPFADTADEGKSAFMEIGMNHMTIEEQDETHGIGTRVTYFILPEETLPALVRKVEIRNMRDEKRHILLLDGMPAIIPYGVDMTSLKEMAETCKAWMTAEVTTEHCGIFRVRASMEDTAEVTRVEGANFAIAYTVDGHILSPIYDPEAVFAYDTAFLRPVRFLDRGLLGIAEGQNASNEVPCAFFAGEQTLEARGSLVWYELYGAVEKQETLTRFLDGLHDAAYFEAKLHRSDALTKQLTQVIATKTADPRFDAYSRYTYMDNVLRGGVPTKLSEHATFYVYSRKHGDLERDYNYFAMLPEYYSQGNGNFRDVNQNRRNDPFFSPFVGRKNIRLFYSLIQPDGYNPLGIEVQTYRIAPEKLADALKGASAEQEQAIRTVTAGRFTPGMLAETAEESLFSAIMEVAEEETVGKFGEGYWSDHWDYNLDLIEEYLAVFPEQENELFSEKCYTWFAPQVRLLPRAKRCEVTKNGIRQYRFLEEMGAARAQGHEMTDAKGAILVSDLYEKMLVMILVKLDTLDPYGMGVEMEGGKPGWYDALNGLPAMLGSSMAESCELLRMVCFLRRAVKAHAESVSLFLEAAELMEETEQILEQHLDEITAANGTTSGIWDAANDAKEAYRARIYQGISGTRKRFTKARILHFLALAAAVLEAGIEKAKRLSDGVFPTYFYYEVTAYTEDEKGIHPQSFVLRKMPLFLEGAVRCLKLPLPLEEKKALYDAVKNSRLYDRKLQMYKVNAALHEASVEIGRCRSFTSGWLENESIWLHMEYKYLLELLKSGLYEVFFEDFRHACTAFMDAAVYGRNPLENTSFIASSANPDKRKWGRGFVARLSGSTAEFLSMWRRMFFGETPFVSRSGQLFFAPQPALPAYLIGAEGIVEAMLLGTIPVTYEIGKVCDLIPGKYQIVCFEITGQDGSVQIVEATEISGEMALAIRAGEIVKIKIKIV